MQSIIASDGNVSFVILLYSSNRVIRPISVSFNESEYQNFQLGSENKHIFRIDG